jgi:hypothetical protein
VQQQQAIEIAKYARFEPYASAVSSSSSSVSDWSISSPFKSGLSDRATAATAIPANFATRAQQFLG